MKSVLPEGYEKIEIDTPDGVLSFTGKLLGLVDNERRGRPRWAEIELYKYVVGDEDDPRFGEEMYLLHTMGHSVVYHRHDAPCNKGMPVPVEEFRERAEFPDDLEPCTDVYAGGRLISKGCYPADWMRLPAGTVLDLEMLRHTRHVCPEAEDVLRRLRQPSRRPCADCGGQGYCTVCRGRGYLEGEPVLTAPGRQLVEIVRLKDAGIARAAAKKITL